MKTSPKIATLAFAVAFACGAVLAPRANATAVIAATEPTQILNHIELIAQYEKQVQQAITQLHSYMALAQQLKNLPQSARDQITGVAGQYRNFNANDINVAQQMIQNLQSQQGNLATLSTQDQHAYDTIQYLNAQGHQITPYQYEMGMALLAQQHADTYGQQMQAYQTSLSNQRTAMQKLAELNAAAPNIASNVGGLQAVVQTNAVLGQQLANINTSLTTAAAVQTQQAQDEAQDRADKKAADACSAALAARFIGGGQSGQNVQQVCQQQPAVHGQGG